MKILIADDRSLNRKLLRAILEAESYNVIECDNGVEALQLLKQEDFQALISDILMPELDGFRLTQAVRMIEKLHSLPIILYSASTFSQDVQNLALKVGADRFIQKPAPNHIILENLKEVLRQEIRGPRRVIPVPSEFEVMREFSEVLIQKLEETNFELDSNVRELKETESRYRQIIENLSQVLFLSGPGGKPLIYLSPAYEKIWGRSCAEAMSDPDVWLRGVIPEDQATVSGVFSRWDADCEVEFRIRDNDGQIRWIRSRTFPIRNQDGLCYRLCGILENVTDWKAAEEERRWLESQLNQAMKMEAVGRLAGGVAHDFNNMLSVILGFCEIARSREASAEEIGSCLVEIEGAAFRSADLTRQLLAYSRRQTIAPDVLDLNDRVRTMKTILERTIGEDIDLKFNLSPNLHRVWLDHSQVDQMLSNLVINSRDAMPDGGTLGIATSNVTIDGKSFPHQANHPGEYILLAVSDTGCGMDPSTLEKVFEPFFTTKEEGKGTGLGLATVYGIVKQNDGFIDISSRLGQGTTIKIYIPRLTGEPHPRLGPTTEVSVLGGTETILVVEDQPQLLQLINISLQRLGYQVLIAPHPQKAIALFEATAVPIHLLLTDVVLPGKNGRGLADHLRGLDPGIKVLYMSGYTSETIAHRGILEAGVNFIQKPFSTPGLARKIRETLSG